MPRYFIEVVYKGTNYAGFQIQDNANTIQSEIEKALSTYFRNAFSLTGSSRTDAGVHAKQNFFHFDSDQLNNQLDFAKAIYHLNAILPLDIVIKSINQVNEEAHCRFDAKSRTYEYMIYQNKNPFLQDTAFFYPFKLDFELLQTLASELKKHSNFESFSKRSTQVHTFNCIIHSSEWIFNEEILSYKVTANRFLRGMVKGLVGTMLKSVSKKQSINQFQSIVTSKNPAKVDFSVPSHGLTLLQVNF